MMMKTCVKVIMSLSATALAVIGLHSFIFWAEVVMESKRISTGLEIKQLEWETEKRKLNAAGIE